MHLSDWCLMRCKTWLNRYISAEALPVAYGGLKREGDSEFSLEDEVSELFIKANSTETIEIPAPQV